MTSHLINRVAAHFIEIGKSNDLDHLENSDALQKIHDLSRRHSTYFVSLKWKGLVETLATTELAALTKGYAFCETRFQWLGGSVSPVITMFHSLQWRDSKVADALADWILPRTHNAWSPYGTSVIREKSVKEYRKTLKARLERINLHVCRELELQRLATIDRTMRKNQRLASARDRDSNIREKLKSDLSPLTIEDQLQRLINDQNYSVDFYPTCLAGSTTHDVIASLNADFKLALLGRLKGKHRGPWGGLKKRLLVSLRPNSWGNSTPWDKQKWIL